MPSHVVPYRAPNPIQVGMYYRGDAARCSRRDLIAKYHDPQQEFFEPAQTGYITAMARTAITVAEEGPRLTENYSLSAHTLATRSVAAVIGYELEKRATLLERDGVHALRSQGVCPHRYRGIGMSIKDGTLERLAAAQFDEPMIRGARGYMELANEQGLVPAEATVMQALAQQEETALTDIDVITQVIQDIVVPTQLDVEHQVVAAMWGTERAPSQG